MNNEENKSEIQKEARELLLILDQLMTSVNKNKDSKILSLNKLLLSKYLFPYLEIKDLLNLRASCRELNLTIISIVTLVSYLKNHQGKVTHHKSTNVPILKSFTEINDIEDVHEQIESLKRIKEYLTKKIFQSESFIKVCKTDIEYLKNQLNTQTQLANTLNDSLNNTRAELEQYKEENTILAHNYQESNKKMKENTLQLQKENEMLLTKIDKLNYEVESLNHTIYKLNKNKEELVVKNQEKSSVLKQIRNYFFTSELFNIKNIADLEKENEGKQRKMSSGSNE
jgi:chromosome segregation ATPase